MPGPITQEYILKGTAQFDDIQQKVNQAQNFLNGLKLPTNLKASFTQTFTEMGNSIKKASGLLNQGFSSKGQLSSFNKEINNITAGFDRLGKDMAKISPEALEKSVPMIQQYKTQLQEISNAAADVEKKMQGKIGEEWETSMKRIVDEMQGLSSSDKIKNFAEQFQAGKLQEADEILKDITRTVGHFKDAGKTNDFKNWCEQARDALEQTQRATVEEQQALTQLGGQAEQVVASGMNDLANGVNKTTQDMNKLKDETLQTGNNINAMGQKSVQASTDLDQFKSRITYFFGLNNGVQLVRRAFTKLIQTMKELDEVMTQTAVVTDYTVGDMWSQLPEITARANDLGVAIKSVYEADMLFYQQGLKTNQVLELSNESMKMARIAGLDAKTATDRMTNALRGFNMELDKTNAQRINDVYNALAARTASNVQEISSAMTKVASLANSANMSFENTAAFLAQIVETTRESAETAGTALKTVIARFSEVKKLVSEGELTGQTEEGEEIDVNKVSTALRAANIDLNEYLTGAKGLDQIFMELSSKWDSLDIVTQRYIATMAAGSRQQSRFIALMQDYSRMQELTGIATNANGAAQQQFEKTLESFETVVNRLKNAWNSFLLGLANNEVIKGAINLLTGLINTISKLIDTLSLGSDGLKTFITAFLAIGAFKIGRSLVTKMFAGIGAMMHGEGLKAGASFQKGFTSINFNPIAKIRMSLGRAGANAATLQANANRKLVITEQSVLRAQAKVNKCKVEDVVLTDRQAKAILLNSGVVRDEAQAQQIFNLAKEKGISLTEAYLQLSSKEITEGSINAATTGTEAIAEEGLTDEKIKGAGASKTLTGAEELENTQGKIGLLTKLKLYAALLFGNQQKRLMALRTLGLAGAEEAEALATGQASGAQWSLNAAMYACPIGWIVAGIAALVAVIAIFCAVTESASERSARLHSELEASTETLKKNKEAQEELSAALNEINEYEDIINNNIKGTEEWETATKNLNEKVKDLIENYSWLKDHVHYDENGNLVIDQAGKDKIEKGVSDIQKQTAGLAAQAYYTEATASKWAEKTDTVMFGTKRTDASGFESFEQYTEETDIIQRAMADDAEALEKINTTLNTAYTISDLSQNWRDIGQQYIAKNRNIDLKDIDVFHTEYVGDAAKNAGAWSKVDGSGADFYYDFMATKDMQRRGNLLLSIEQAAKDYTDDFINNLNDDFGRSKAFIASMFSDYNDINNIQQAIPEVNVHGKEYSDYWKNFLKNEAEEVWIDPEGNVKYTYLDEDKEKQEATYMKADEAKWHYAGAQYSEQMYKEAVEYDKKLTNLINNYNDDESIQELIYKFIAEGLSGLDENQLLKLANNDKLQVELKELYGAYWNQLFGNFDSSLQNEISQINLNRLKFVNTTGDEDIQKIDKNGVSSIYLNEQIVETIDILDDKIKLYGKDTTEISKKIVAKNATIQKGLDDLISSYDKWGKLIQETGELEVFSDEDEAVFDTYVNDFNEIFNITTSLSSEFYKNAENVQLLTEALQGSERAYNQLAKKVALEKIRIDIDNTVDEEVKEDLKTIQQMIQNIDLGSLHIGDIIDQKDWINSLNQMLANGRIAADKLKQYFASINITTNFSTEKAYYDANGHLISNIEAEYEKNKLTSGILFGQRSESLEHYIQRKGYIVKEIAQIDSLISGGDNSGTGLNTKDNTEKPNLNYSQIDEYTNNLRLIEGLEQNIANLEAERNNLLVKNNYNAKEYLKLAKEQLGFLNQQKSEMQELQQLRLKQLTEFKDSSINGENWKIEGTLSNGESGLIDVKDFAKYISWDDKGQKLNIDWTTYNAVTNEIWKSNFDAVLSAMESQANEYISWQQKIWDIEKAQKEILMQSRDAYLNLEDTLLEALIWERQQVIDALTAINENINDAQSEIMDLIQSQIDLERQIRDNTKKEDEISDIENQIAFLSRDTSGANDVRIKELQKSFNDMTEEYQDTLIDQELQRITDANEEAAKQRERQINILTQSLEYDKQRGNFWDQIKTLIEGIYTGEVDFNTDSNAYKIVENFYKQQGDSGTKVTSELEGFKENALTASVFSSGTSAQTSNLNSNLNKYNPSQLPDVISAQNNTSGAVKSVNTNVGGTSSKTVVQAIDNTIVGPSSLPAILAAPIAGIATGISSALSWLGLPSLSNNSNASPNGPNNTSFLGAVGNVITTGITSAVNSITGAIGGLPSGIASPITGAVGALPSAIANPITGAIGGLPSGIVNPITGAVVSVNTAVNSNKTNNTTWFGALKGGVEGVWTTGANIFGNINTTNSRLTTVNSNINTTNSKLGTTKDKIVEGFNKIGPIIPTGTSSGSGGGGGGKYTLMAYATGGLATSTGPAWLDGTPNRPEYVLNPVQTETFLQLPDLLRSLDFTAGQNISYGDTSIEINIQVDQLASDYDVEQLAEKIKTEIYDDSAYRNVNSIGWIR